MARYYIKATYTYEGAVEADSKDEAEKTFLADLNSFYSGTDEFEMTDLPADCDCEDEPDLDGSCFNCREEEN